VRASWVALLTATVLGIAPAAAQVPAVWFSGLGYGARWPTLANTPDMSNGVFAFNYQNFQGDRGAINWGYNSWYGNPLQYRAIISTGNRTFTIYSEYIYTAGSSSAPVDYYDVVVQATEPGHGFNSFGGPFPSNFAWFVFPNIPADGRQHSILVEYNMDQGSAALSLDNSPYRAPDMNVSYWSGPFKVGLQNEPVNLWLDTYGVTGYFPQQNTGYIGATSFALFIPYEGPSTGPAIFLNGNTQTYPINNGYGGPFFLGAFPGFTRPSDYSMPFPGR
jgi:hypothetical protein